MVTRAMGARERAFANARGRTRVCPSRVARGRTLDGWRRTTAN